MTLERNNLTKPNLFMFEDLMPVYIKLFKISQN